MHWYGGLLEPWGSKLTLLKSTFNAENFACKILGSNAKLLTEGQNTQGQDHSRNAKSEDQR